MFQYIETSLRGYGLPLSGFLYTTLHVLLRWEIVSCVGVEVWRKCFSDHVWNGRWVIGCVEVNVGVNSHPSEFNLEIHSNVSCPYLAHTLKTITLCMNTHWTNKHLRDSVSDFPDAFKNASITFKVWNEVGVVVWLFYICYQYIETSLTWLWLGFPARTRSEQYIVFAIPVQITTVVFINIKVCYLT